MTEDKTYKAKKKDGKVVVFKDKDNWKKALKTGDYEKVDSEPKKTIAKNINPYLIEGSNIFINN